MEISPSLEFMEFQCVQDTAITGASKKLWGSIVLPTLHYIKPEKL